MVASLTPLPKGIRMDVNEEYCYDELNGDALIRQKWIADLLKLT